MEANWQLSENLEKNTQEFKSDFFQRYTLRENKAPITLNSELKKNYVFPTFYNNVSCSVGIFLCDYGEASKIMIDSKIKPLKMPFNRSLVIFSSYEYKSVYNIKPYNEIAMTIPIMANASFSPPLLPLVFSSYFKAFGYYVFSMPVTSYENEIRGHKIWGLPKKTQKIAITQSKEQSKTTTYSKNNKKLFTLNVPMEGSKQHFDVTSPLYSKKENEILKSFTSFKGDFNLTKNMGLIFKRNLEKIKKSEFLSFNEKENPILTGLKIHPIPIQTRFTKKMQSCFDLPVDESDGARVLN